MFWGVFCFLSAVFAVRLAISFITKLGRDFVSARMFLRHGTKRLIFCTFATIMPLSAGQAIAAVTINASVNYTWLAESRTVTFTITVKNNSTTPISNVQVAATVFNQGTVYLTSPDAAINDGTPNAMGYRETWTYTYSYTPTQAMVNAKIGTYYTHTFSTQGQTAYQYTSCIAPDPRLDVLKYADKTTNVKPGDVITYSIYVSNSGNITMRNITLNDVTNGYGAHPTPTNEVIYGNSIIPSDTHDSSIDGKWDALGYGGTIKFTSTYVVTTEDIENLQ